MKLFKQKEKEFYYNISDLDKTNAVYKIAIGKRSNGKTYAVIKKIIKEYFKTGKPSAYIRRFDSDLKSVSMSNLIAPELQEYIKKLSRGKYDSVIYKARKIYLGKSDAKTRKITTSGNVLIYCYALSTWEHEKGGDPGELYCIFFDEFLTRGAYLKDEFILFSNLISTLKRDRTVNIYMMGNTVNQYSPYWDEMGIYNIEKQKKGTIYIYTYNDPKLTVAVEYCADSLNTKETDYYFAFDNPQLDMITNGDWEQGRYKHLKERYTKEDIYFTFHVIWKGHILKGNVYKRNKQLFIYYMHETNQNFSPSDKDIIYTDRPCKSLLHCNSFREYNTKKQKLIYNLMKAGRDYYTDNTTGENVRNFMLNGGDSIAI